MFPTFAGPVAFKPPFDLFRLNPVWTPITGPVPFLADIVDPGPADFYPPPGIIGYALTTELNFYPVCWNYFLFEECGFGLTVFIVYAPPPCFPGNAPKVEFKTPV